MVESKGRPVGGTEHSWCRAVSGGTGIAVLALHTSKAPDVSLLQTALQKLQNSHPILKSGLISNTSTNTFSFLTSPTPFVDIKSFNPTSTFHILENLAKPSNHEVSPFHLILEHELNMNSWHYNKNSSNPLHNCTDMLFASVYALSNAKWVVVLRLHVSACDRTTAVSLLKELVVLIGEGKGGGIQSEVEKKGEVSLGIEKLIPPGKAKKPLWAHGVDMLSYSVNSLRLTNLKFKDAKSPRSSEVVRLQLNQIDTQKILIVSHFYMWTQKAFNYIFYFVHVYSLLSKFLFFFFFWVYRLYICLLSNFVTIIYNSSLCMKICRVANLEGSNYVEHWWPLD